MHSYSAAVLTAMVATIALASVVGCASLISPDSPPTPTATAVQAVPDGRWLITRAHLPDRAPVGGTFVAEIEVINSGPASMDATLEVRPSASLEFISSDPAAVLGESGVLVWTLTGLRSGERRVVNAVFRTIAEGSFGIDARAFAGVSLFAQDSGKGIAITSNAFAVHVAIVDERDPVSVGDEIAYLLQVRAQGLAYPGGVVHVQLPPGVELSSSDPATSADEAGGLLYDVPALQRGETWEATLRVSAVTTGAKLVAARLFHGDDDRAVMVQERTWVEPALGRGG